MSAFEITDKLVDAIDGGSFDLIICNYANGDMVGHTGDFDAAKKAIETVDTCVGRVVEAIERAGGAYLITADHGNAEQMVHPETGAPQTAHTTFFSAAYLCRRTRCHTRGRQTMRSGAHAAVDDEPATTRGDDRETTDPF